MKCEQPKNTCSAPANRFGSSPTSSYSSMLRKKPERERLARLDAQAGAEYRSDALTFTGTAAELADLLLRWQQLGIDGFRLRPGVVVDDLDAIAGELVPELQRRSVFRTEYPQTNLRGLLGLPIDVPNRYAAVLRPPDRRGIHFHEFSEA